MKIKIKPNVVFRLKHILFESREYVVLKTQIIRGMIWYQVDVDQQWPLIFFSNDQVNIVEE